MIDSRQQRGEEAHKLTSHDIKLASNELLNAAEQANWEAARERKRDRNRQRTSRICGVVEEKRGQRLYGVA